MIAHAFMAPRPNDFLLTLLFALQPCASLLWRPAICMRFQRTHNAFQINALQRRCFFIGFQCWALHILVPSSKDFSGPVPFLHIFKFM